MSGVLPGLDALVFAAPRFNGRLHMGCCQSINQSNQSIDTQNENTLKIQQTAAKSRPIEQTQSPLYNHPHHPIHAPRKPKPICTWRGTTPKPNPRSIRGPVEVLQGKAETDQPNACKFGWWCILPTEDNAIPWREVELAPAMRLGFMPHPREL